MAQPNLTKAHVQTLPLHDLLTGKVVLPAPPTGLTWNQMILGWARHDVIRVNGLT